jgi:hypothetical protein
VKEMRAKLLMTVSALAFATPAFAADFNTYVPPSGDPIYSPQPMVVGHLELGIGILSSDDFGIGEDLGAFVGAGRANIPFSGGAWNIELEAGGGALFDDGESISSIGAAGHVWTKLNGAAIGVFGAVNFPTGATVYTLGLEGEAYLGNVTLGADADYNWVDGLGDGEFWSVSGWADFYFTPDFRLGGELAYLSGDVPDTWSAALDAEYRFSGSPFSLWAEGKYTSIEAGPDADIWAGLVGFRVFMDGAGETLQGHDRQVPWESGLIGPGLVF